MWYLTTLIENVMSLGLTTSFVYLIVAESYREKWPDVSGLLSKKLKRLCSVEGIYKKIPVAEWLPKYKRSFFLQDVVAGLTVALTVIPQGIADAALAGLPPQYGLYAGFMGEIAEIFEVLS
jgi:Sulfate permease family